MGKRAFRVIKLGYRIFQYDIVTKTAAIFLLMSGLIAETIFYNRKYSQRGLTNYHLQTLYSALSFIHGFHSFEVRKVENQLYSKAGYGDSIAAKY